MSPRFLYLLVFLPACSSAEDSAARSFDPDLPVSTENPMRYDKPGRRPGPDGAFHYRRETMLSDDGTIAADGISKALQHREQQLALEFETAGIQPGSWKWLGPGNVGGRCRGLWIKPNDPDTLVLGSVSGGIWRSTDAGASWDAVADFPASLNIGCVAGAKNSSSLLWAGTGEGFGNLDAMRGAGIYSSTDGGLTFTRLRSTTTSLFWYVNRIAFSPNNSQLVLVGTKSGIMRTTNAGDTFTRVSSGECLDLKFDPVNGNLAIAAGEGPSSVRYSTNGGLKWFFASGIPAGAKRVELAYAPSDPRTVYASVEMDGASSRIYRSGDGGRTYLMVSAPNLLGGQGWYDNAIWVAPDNPRLVVVGGVKLFRSVNSGISFTPISGLHDDQHVILHHPGYNGRSNRIVYVCNDGGIYRTNDVAANPVRWTKLANGLGITQFYDGAVTASGRPHGGTQDNGTQQLVNPLFKTTRMIWGADGLQAEADPTDPNVLFGEGQWVGVFRSMDGGNTGDPIVNNLADSGKSNGAPWSGAMRIDPSDPNRMWMGTTRLWRTDNVKTPVATNVYWKLVKADAGPYTAVDVAPGNSDSVVVGKSNGAIYRSRNATANSPTWVQINKASSPSRRVNRIRIDPNNSNRIYVAYGGFSRDNVWVTENGGSSWSPAGGVGSTSLPAAPIRGLALHPRNEGWVYAGTEVGIYASTDGGRTWSTSTEGPATVAVDDIEIRPNGEIFAFTYGRGIYQAHAGMPEDPLAGTTRASLDRLGGESNGHSYRSSMNADGRWVAYGSVASDIVILDTNNTRDVFVRDRQSGENERISVSTEGTQANGASRNPSMTQTGRFVAFESLASNLVVGDNNGRSDIFVHDRTMTRTEIITMGRLGSRANNHSYQPAISADGRFVSFYSLATNLTTATDTANSADVFLHDRALDRTIRVSLAPGSKMPSDQSYVLSGALSADGTRLVYYSRADNLVSGDTNNTVDVFLYERPAGGIPRTSRLSLGPGGAQANGASYQPSISSDGRFVTYYSAASNLVPGDNNGVADVFLLDLSTGQTRLISRRSGGGVLANKGAYGPLISADGQWVAFESSADNLVPGDGNGRVDVFVYRIASDELFRVSRSSIGVEPNQNCSNAAISGDGKYVSFNSSATNLVPFDSNGKIDVFVAENGLVHSVFPQAVTSTEGNSSTSLPLGSSNTRLQQVYRETKGRSMGIRRIAFRRNAGAASSGSGARIIELSMKMGGADIDSFATRFNNNWIGAPTEVIRRKAISIPSWTNAPGGLAEFNGSLPLDATFQHTGSRDLMFELATFANTIVGGHIADAHAGDISVGSTSASIGRGCATPGGANFLHSLNYRSLGTSSTLTFAVQQAPPSAPISLAMGVRNPDLQLPGWCTRLHTDALSLLPMGNSNSAGQLGRAIPLGAYNPNHAGLVLYTQAASLVGPGYFSQGLRLSMPVQAPGPAVKRLFASPRASTGGTLQNLGAVTRFTY